MAEKPPEEGYISVVDEEPELLELLRWEDPQNQKASEARQDLEHESAPKLKSPQRKAPKPADIDPFDLPEPQFIENYRLTKELTRSLCEELKPVMPETINKVTTEVSLTNKVLSALAFFASGKIQKQKGVQMGKCSGGGSGSGSGSDPNLPLYLVQQAVLQVVQALNHPSLVKKYIHFPHLAEERNDIRNRFYMKYGIPNVLGCIDCTHVPICKPDNDEKSHFNKSFHSKKVQIISDSSQRIVSVHPMGGALSHDAVLARHAVTSDLLSLRAAGDQCWLIGGPYYTVKPYLMTPVPKITKKSPASPEKCYNNLHAQAHSCVLDTIKHLKSRWKCLQASHKHLDLATVSMMVVACSILHNMCNSSGLPPWPMTPGEERLEVMKQKVANGPVPRKLSDDDEGNEVRQQLVARIWSERRVEPEVGRKRMTKKDRLLQGYHPGTEPGTRTHQGQGQGQGSHCHSHAGQAAGTTPGPEPKRPRPHVPAHAHSSLPPPHYGLMHPQWTQYPPHHL